MKNTFIQPFVLWTFHIVLLFNQANAQTGCLSEFSYLQNFQNYNINFTDLSTSPNTVATWLWNFGEGSISNDQNPSHQYALDGTYKVCLTIQDTKGCSNSICHQLTINPAPCHAAFASSLAGNAIYFLNNSTSTGPTLGTMYLWDFGDGNFSNEQNPIHTFTSGTYTVCLTMTTANGCMSKICQQFTINGTIPCQASFTYQVDPVNNEHIFKNTSTGVTNNTKYSWDFGDGITSTDENPHHAYLQPGNYTVCLLIGDHSTGCNNNICQPVNYKHTDTHFHALEGESVTPKESKTDALLIKANNIMINPNPFNTQSIIQYQLNGQTNVKIEVYDFMRYRINLIVNELESEGLHSHILIADHLNSGFYYIKMQLGKDSFTKRISILK